MEQITGKIKPKTYDLLYDLSRELHMPHELSKVKVALEAVLHSLAARLDLDRGIEVITNLPVHLKDTFSQGWKPFLQTNSADFISAVQERITDSFKYSKDQVLLLVRKVFSVLARYIAPDKMKKIHSCMDADVRAIINYKF
jgi:uncharacterized protein (DUF2267 family)